MVNTVGRDGMPTAPDASIISDAVDTPPANTVRRSRFCEIAGGMGVIAIVVVSLVPGGWRPSIGLANVLEHILAYSVVAAILAAGFRGGWQQVAGLVVPAAVLEIGQRWVPGRDPSTTDFLGSSTGALLGYGLSSLTPARLRILAGTGTNDASGSRSRSFEVAGIGAVIGIGAALVLISIAAVHGTASWLGAGLGLVMLAIAVVDGNYLLIPDPLNVAALMLGLVNSAVSGHGDPTALAEAVLRAGVVAAAFLGLREAYARLRRRQGMGLGDVKLAAVAGIWLNWSVLPVAVEIAALSALATFALCRYVLRHGLWPTSRLPFGLFLAPAIWIGWLLQTTSVLNGW